MSEERTQTVTESTDSFSSALDGILSNPAMMSMISSMAEQLKSGGLAAAPTSIPQAENAAEPAVHNKDSNDTKLPEAISALAPLLSGKLGTNAPDSRRDCLLKALKPYMSEGRGEAIDTIIKISKISDVLKTLS